MTAIITSRYINDNRSYSLKINFKNRQNNRKSIYKNIYTLSQKHIIRFFTQKERLKCSLIFILAIQQIIPNISPQRVPFGWMFDIIQRTQFSCHIIVTNDICFVRNLISDAKPCTKLHQRMICLFIKFVLIT